MAESNLGTAVLSLRVETGPALAALKAFRAQVESSLGTADTSGLFKGVEGDARAAGEKAGKALADGVKKQTKELKFGSFQQALDFTPKNSIKGLEEYARALRNLRDRTDLTAAGTQQLTDRLGAVDSALRQARQTTAEAAAEQRRFNEALDKVALQRFSEQARGFAAGLREQAKAAAANADQFRRMREQAEGAAKAIAGLAAKGVGEALKVPIFGLPKNVTGTFDKARAQIERLQKQAETASGKVARLSEGVAVLGAGGVAAKGVIDVLGGIGGAAADTTGILSQVQQALASLPGPLKGLGGLDDVFASGAQAVSNWAASILQAQGELSTLAAPLEAVTNSLGALGPEAVAVGGALAFTFAGFQDLIAKSFKPGVDGARAALKGMTADTQALLEALARASEASAGIASLRDLRIAEKDATARVQAAPAGTDENLQATQELLEIQRRIKNELQAQFYQEQRLLLTEQERAQIARQLQDAAKPSAQLALPSSQILDAEGRGIRRLTPDVGPAIDVGLQNARNFTQELVRAGQAGDKLPGIFSVVNQSLKQLVDTTAEQTLGLQVQRELLQDQLTLQNQLRAVEAQRSKEARSRNEQAVANSPERQRARQELDLLAVQNKRRAAEAKETKRRVSEASSNALIGGAFPALFGQGLGASVGGALGGGAGGLVGGQFGFGLSLVGTALGSQFDIATQKLQTLGQALSDPIKQFSALSEAGLISSKGLEKQIQALIDTGREAEAAALIQQDLASTYGDLQGAKELSAASDELNRSWAKLQATTASLIGLPLVSLLSDTSSALLVFAEAVSKLRDLIPKPVADAGGNFLKQFALGGLLPGVKTVQDAARFIPGSQGVSGFFAGLLGGGGGNNELTQQNDQLNSAKQNYADLNTLAYQLVTAQAQGNKELEIGLRKREIQLKLERDSATLNESNDPGGIRRQSLIDKAKQDAFALDEQLKLLTNGSLTDLQNKLTELSSRNSRLPVDSQAYRDSLQEIINEQTRLNELKKTESQRFAESIAAANQLRSIQEEIAIQQQRGSLTGTGIGALQALRALEDAKRAEQNAQANLRTSPGDTSLLNAAQLASENVALAAAKTKADLEDAYIAAERSVQSISRSIEDAVTALDAARGGAAGVNRYIAPQQARDRQVEANTRLFATANELANALGVVASFSGSLTQRNSQLEDFIRSARQELRASQDINQLNDDLTRSQNDLATVNGALFKVNEQLYNATSNLASSTEALANKDWNVYVSVPGGSATGDVTRPGIF